MAQKVFVFGIGGTGLRVMKSIIMLLSSGFDSKGYTIVPVLIDPHQDLDERTQLTSLIEEYIDIYRRTTGANVGNANTWPHLDGFFRTEVKTLEELDQQQNPINDSMADQRIFSDYLELGNLPSDDINQYIVQTLFSQNNLDSSLSVGFKGNPNVGTVVLGDMIEGADWFAAFERHCERGDRVFIISSIFGGTGASGYPLLEKKIRNNTNPNVKSAVMGAVTVFPYFALKDPTATGSSIDSANFMTKTKSALAYYEKNVVSDFLYYIGDTSLNATYDNDESKQDNKANFIELVAATALFDFLSKAKDNTTQYLSRAIKSDVEVLDLNTLGDGYKDVIKAVADLNFLQEIINFLRNETSFPLVKTRLLDEQFYRDESFKKLNDFINNRYSTWFDQLSNNKRAFAPINTDYYSQRIKGVSLKAKSLAYYILRMIKESNNAKDENNNIQIRHLLNFAYKAINFYTNKIYN